MQGVCGNPAIGEKLLQLSERLNYTRGKKVYGYLKADVKRLVDQIVDELAKDPTVAEAYRAWGEWQAQILLTYSSKAPSLPPLSSQKQLKSIKNMVIAEALKLGGHHFLYDTSMQGDGSTGIRLDELEVEISDALEDIKNGNGNRRILAETHELVAPLAYAINDIILSYEKRLSAYHQTDETNRQLMTSLSP